MSTQASPRGFWQIFLATLAGGLPAAVLSLAVLAIPALLTGVTAAYLMRVSLFGFLALGLTLALAQAGPLAAFGLRALGEKAPLRTVLSLAVRRLWRLIPGRAVLVVLYLVVPVALFDPIVPGRQSAESILLSVLVVAAAISLTAWLLLIVPAVEVLEEDGWPVRAVARQRELPNLRRAELLAAAAAFWLTLKLPAVAGLARVDRVGVHVVWPLVMTLLILPALSGTLYARSLGARRSEEVHPSALDTPPRTAPMHFAAAAIPIVLLSLPGVFLLRDPLLLWTAERGILPAARFFSAMGGTLDREETPSLWRFAARGDVRRVKAMLALGAPVSRADGLGKTPLHYASESGQVVVMRVLLAAGADAKTASRGGNTPLMAAAAGGNADAVRL
ncbi:MAG TPA: ankyrin repeat domain-containing protein, partial [Thermoanaerobaculia bacterium]